MGPTFCPEMSVRKYHSVLRRIPEERRSQVPITFDASGYLPVRPSVRPSVRPFVWQNVTHRETIKHFNGVQCSFAKPYRQSPVSIETTETGQEKHIMKISSLNAFQNFTVNLQIFIRNERASTHFPCSTNILSFTHFARVLWFSK